MEPSDLRWLAGLLEGEGTFLRPVPSAPRAPLIRLAMTDHDVVRRAAGLLERSVVSAEGGRVHGHRTVFMVTVRAHPPSAGCVSCGHISARHGGRRSIALWPARKWPHARRRSSRRRLPLPPSSWLGTVHAMRTDLQGFSKEKLGSASLRPANTITPASSWRCATRKSSAGPPTCSVSTESGVGETREERRAAGPRHSAFRCVAPEPQP